MIIGLIFKLPEPKKRSPLFNIPFDTIMRLNHQMTHFDSNRYKYRPLHDFLESNYNVKTIAFVISATVAFTPKNSFNLESDSFLTEGWCHLPPIVKNLLLQCMQLFGERPLTS